VADGQLGYRAVNVNRESNGRNNTMRDMETDVGLFSSSRIRPGLQGMKSANSYLTHLEKRGTSAARIAFRSGTATKRSLATIGRARKRRRLGQPPLLRLRLVCLAGGAHLVSDRVRHRLLVVINWAWNYLTFHRGTRRSSSRCDRALPVTGDDPVGWLGP